MHANLLHIAIPAWLLIVATLYGRLPQALASRHWPVVEGRVGASHARLIKAGYAWSWAPVVEYTYSWQGDRYQNDTVAYIAEDNSMIRSKVDAFLAAYPAGASVPVSVNPKNPRQTVLKPGVRRWPQLVGMVAFLALLFLGLAFIVQILDFFFPGCQPNCR